jgi:hypothetical protein
MADNWLLFSIREIEMSRLIEKLNKQKQSDPQPMGFMLSKPRDEKPGMLLLAAADSAALEAVRAVEKTADALVISISKADDLAEIEKRDQSKDSLPAGGWLKTATAAVVKKAQNTPADFWILTPSLPVALTRQEKLGRILEVDLNLSEGLLRAAGDLPVDALLASGKNSEMVVNLNRLLYVQRLLHMASKPLIVTVADTVTAPELQALWDIGVAAVMVEVADEKAAAHLAEIRACIAKLEAPAYRKKSRATALLPRIQAEQPAVEQEEEEDE